MFLCFKYYLDSNIAIHLRDLKKANPYMLAVKKNIQFETNGGLSTEHLNITI